MSSETKSVNDLRNFRLIKKPGIGSSDASPKSKLVQDVVPKLFIIF